MSGDFMETLKVSQRGCPDCNMTCDMVMDSEDQASEIGYERVSFAPDSLLEYFDLAHAIHEVDTIDVMRNCLQFL